MQNQSQCNTQGQYLFCMEDKTEWDMHATAAYQLSRTIFIQESIFFSLNTLFKYFYKLQPSWLKEACPISHIN